MALSRLQQLELVFGWGHLRKDLRSYGVLWSEGGAAAGRRMLSHTTMRDRIRPALNKASSKILAEDKWVSYRLLAGLGVPVPRTLGLYDHVHGVTWDGQRPLRTAAELVTEVRAQRPGSLVLKPSRGTQGQGLLILDSIDYGTGAAVTRTGVDTTLEAAVSGLDAQVRPDGGGYVVQEAVSSHPQLQQLAPWTTNTIRVVTIVDLSGQVHVQAAALTLGSQGSMANNWHAGGVNVYVDVETGESWAEASCSGRRSG